MANLRIAVSYLPETTRRICLLFSFNCTFIEYTGTDYGTGYENGTGIGMIGQVLRGEIDTIEPLITPGFSRYQIIDFSDTYYYSDVILATRGVPITHVSFKLVLAWEWNTWVVFLISLGVATIFMSTTRKALGISNLWTVAHCLKDVLDIVPELITHKYRQKSSKWHKLLRPAIALWSLAMMVLSFSYTGILFSQELQDPDRLPYKDMETFGQCLQMGKCRMIASSASISYVQDLMKHIDPTQVRLAPIEEIPKLILAEPHVRLVWPINKILFDIFAGSNFDCRYHITEVFKEVWSFPVRKNSSLKRILDRGAAAYQENGLFHTEFQNDRSWRSCYQKSAFKRTSESNILVPTINAALCFLGLGLFGAMWAVCIENAVEKWRSSRRYDLWIHTKNSALYFEDNGFLDSDAVVHL